MNNDSIISEKVKIEIERFSQLLTQEFTKPKKKFISQMLFGIQACRDVKLSNIARSLDEDIKLIKTENRLSRNAQKEDLTKQLNEIIIRQCSNKILPDTVLALDLSDIAKPFAKKMDYLAHVWNGSEGKPDKGYWILAVTAADVNGEAIVPLYSELYSYEANSLPTENQRIIKVVEKISESTDKRGIWALDRGADRKILVEEFDKLKIKFVIRISGRKNLTNLSNEQEKVRNIARGIHCTEAYKITIDKEGYKEDIIEVKLGKRTNLKIKGVELSLVVIKGLGPDSLLLLTNVDKEPKEILEIYLTRWKCEESFRFLKQEYHLEDVRVRRYNALRNTVALVHAVFYFISVYLGRSLKINILLKKILEKAKRFFQLPVFKHYAIADGIYRILFGVKWAQEKIPKENSNQRVFKFAM
ncbi:MAG: transposase [Candidatus Omnitrophica bacterium]|nr:transposase [Candidatus Omnitrophota bacterium]